jgi:hypothetical protein
MVFSPANPVSTRAARRHSSVGYVSPEELELKYEEEKMAA